MSDNNLKENNVPEENTPSAEEYSLNDDRRVKVLSPGAMVRKRFFRNRIAVTGLVVLVIMFIFSFIGGAITPYKEDQLFYRVDKQNKQYAGVTENTDFRYSAADGKDFSSLAQAKFILAATTNKTDFEVSGKKYNINKEGEDLFSIKEGNDIVAIAYKSVVSPSTKDVDVKFNLEYEILKAYSNKKSEFTFEGKKYTINEDGGVLSEGKNIALVSPYIVQAIMGDVFLTQSFKEEITSEIKDGKDKFTFTDENGETHDYSIKYSPANKSWQVLQLASTQVFDTYSSPSFAHPLGTDRNGMDMLTRLMYGGRVSLIIGFIVVFIEAIIGIILGGVSGYFGGWIDNLIMRIVDVFYCIPSMPIIIILGAAMDAMRMDPQLRMLCLMLLLGFLGWPGIARIVRGQILSLREQEFMTATEACGIKVNHRIFRHLIPNVIPQLIVICTMGLGSTIITESTLSFLGVGVKFPFASWGNIISDVTDTYVLTNYWFIWIPAGICLLVTVLAFNLVGDGLRDAFDPKMKR